MRVTNQPVRANLLGFAASLNLPVGGTRDSAGPLPVTKLECGGNNGQQT